MTLRTKLSPHEKMYRALRKIAAEIKSEKARGASYARHDARRHGVELHSPLQHINKRARLIEDAILDFDNGMLSVEEAQGVLDEVRDLED
jgi:hypothetical protein